MDPDSMSRDSENGWFQPLIWAALNDANDPLALVGAATDRLYTSSSSRSSIVPGTPYPPPPGVSTHDQQDTSQITGATD